MKQIAIKSGALQVSAIGMGCMRIASLEEKEVATLVNTALDAGINLFDHADIYGKGQCEKLFGNILKDAPSLRDKIVLQSKCGIRQDFYDLSKSHIINSAEEILKRLNTEYLDVLLLHRPDTLMEPEEIAEAFDKLYNDGKVRNFGVSNMKPLQIELIQKFTKHKIAVNQMQFSAARSGMLDSGINVNVPDTNGCSRDESVLEYCRLNDITMQAWSPLQYGFFGGVFLNSDKYKELNIKLKELAEKYTCEPSAVALAWILRHPANMQVITGSANCEHIKQMAKAGDITLERSEWYDIYKAAGNILP